MKPKRRKRIGLALATLAASGFVWGAFQPLPYIIERPGPAFNVLGEHSGKSVIEVSGVDNELTQGKLDLLTVSEYGVPGDTPNFFDLVAAMFSADSVVLPIELVFPIGESASQTEAKQSKFFEDSKAAATSAALRFVDPEVATRASIKLNLDGIGGPSGGQMFALGIIEKLTPGSLTGGKNIAGTGTIDAVGNIGPIGGIREKLISAVRAGDRYFLAPASNCGEVLGNIPAGLKVFSVSSLAQSLADVKVIAADGDTSKLAVCSAE